MNSLTIQPVQNSVYAGFNPIPFVFVADLLIGITVKPCPVAFCDVYINGTYYKTLDKSAKEASSTGTTSVYLFDIQTPCQEFLKTYIVPRNYTAIGQVTSSIVSVFCRFRSTYLDANGMITSASTAPIQATDTTVAVAGTGLRSNDLFVTDSILQPENNPDLITHLSNFRTPGIWEASTYPITNRPITKNKINLNNSDIYPLIQTTDNDPYIVPFCIKMNYKLKGSDTIHTVSACPAPAGCVTLSFPGGQPHIPDPRNNTPMYVATSILGSTPITITDIVCPAWMTIYVIGNILYFSGTPTEVGTDLPITFTLSNCDTDNPIFFVDSIDVDPENTRNVRVVNNIDSGGWAMQIDDVTGMPVVWDTGAFPLLPGGDVIRGGHNAYTGTIDVVLTGATGHGQLQLMVNGLEIELLTPTTAGTYSFTSRAYLVSDVIVITLSA